MIIIGWVVVLRISWQGLFRGRADKPFSGQTDPSVQRGYFAWLLRLGRVLPGHQGVTGQANFAKHSKLVPS